MSLIDIPKTVSRLKDHLRAITEEIGERTMFSPDKLVETARYIQSVHRENGLRAELEHYPCHDFAATNVIAFSGNPEAAAGTFIVGAHYDCVLGTTGADDNASAIAVQLEVARQLEAMRQSGFSPPAAVKFVSFALEEYPAYWNGCMGSRVHAKRMRTRAESTEGMICLEMVGYCRREPGSQTYPLALRRFGFPDRGDFISIVGNRRSRVLVEEMRESFSKNPDLPVVSLSVPLNGWILPAVRRSDHASFWSRGYKAVMVTDSSFLRNPNYHLPADTMKTLDLEFMAEVVESLLIFLMSRRGAGVS
ncbi:MAG: M28 family peptidase [Desulfobacteraceae bacterium]|nr:M28 family peptidase [Desulfobacteraceae bacterium]